MGETESGVFCSPPSGGLAALGLLLLLVAGGLLVVGPGKPELGETEAADMWFHALFARIVNLVLAFSCCVTVIPLCTRRSIILDLLDFLIFLLLFRLRDGLYGLHH